MSGIVGIDYGRKRIGLAVADPMGITTRGLPTVPAGDTPEATADRVAEALAAVRPERVVVGLPLHDDGDESVMSREVRRFAQALEPRLDCPLELTDESFTTFEAEEAIKARGIPIRDAKRQGLLDQEAARALLRGWFADRPASES